MGLSLDVSVPMITVFIQGVLSFFSPCILPIIPLYMGYLAGGAATDKDGCLWYDRRRVLLHSGLFALGISGAFLLLGLGFSALGQILSGYQFLLTRVGGVIILGFGFMQLGLIKRQVLAIDFRIPIRFNIATMNPFIALALGFTFSFAWTPCVGPTLATVLLMISGTSTSYGFILICIYTLGFIIPFLLLGVFSTKAMEFFKENMYVVDYTSKVGAVIMIIVGLLMLSGKMNNISTLFTDMGNSITTESNVDNGEQSMNGSDHTGQDQSITGNSDVDGEESPNDVADKEDTTDTAPDFQLLDQNGMVHKLSDYKGKVVFLNFWATWCPPCVAELPDIQKIYEGYGYNQEDVIILGVAMPSDQNSWTREGTLSEVKSFLNENTYTYPTVMDMDGSIANAYGINSYPTTFMINTKGELFGYIPGMLEYDTMVDIIEQAK